jgi:transcriptional regulator with XRE-family HTH domain
MKNQVFVKRFGALVKQLRIEKGFSQEEFALRCNLHRTYIGPIERGEKNITLETAYKLAQALDISLSSLFLKIETEIGINNTYRGA